MAWNPSPEVAAVRDAATKISAAIGETVDKAVIVFTTAEGKLGYASYGETRAKCSQAKVLADALYDAAFEELQ